MDWTVLTHTYTLNSKRCVCTHRQTITSIVYQVNQHQHLTASLSLFCEEFAHLIQGRCELQYEG